MTRIEQQDQNPLPNKDKNKNSINWQIYLMIFIGLTLAIVSSLQSVRKKVMIQNDKRNILAKTIYKTDKDEEFTFVKIKSQNAILLEIYQRNHETFEFELKQQFSFDGDHEAFMMIKSEPVNLGIIDIDNDEVKEIICPTVDKNGQSRLNVLQYNKELNQFNPVIENI